MPTFHSPRNPDFKLSSPRLAKAIVFVDGVYSTDDPDEIRALRRHVKAGTLVEGEAGEFHRGGVVPAEGLPLLGTGFVPVPAGAEVVVDGPGPDLTATVGVGEPTESRELADLSNRELREHAEALGISVPRSAGKKALLDAIEIAEQEADDEGEADDDVTGGVQPAPLGEADTVGVEHDDPNDPDGS